MKKYEKIEAFRLAREEFLSSFPEWSETTHADYKVQEGVFFRKPFGENRHMLIAVLFGQTRDCLRVFVGWGGENLFNRREFDWEMRHDGSLARIKQLERVPSFEREESLIDIGFLMSPGALLKGRQYDFGTLGVVVPGADWDRGVIQTVMQDIQNYAMPYLAYFLSYGGRG